MQVLTVLLAVSALIVSVLYLKQSQTIKCQWDNLPSERLGPVAKNASRAVVAIDLTQKTRLPGIEMATSASGFIFDSNGYILTNAHVVERAQNIYVSLADKRRYSAKIVATEPRVDIAVLKIDAENITALELAQKNELEVGQIVIALGNPLGTGDDGRAVATFGRINKLGKTINPTRNTGDDRYYDNLIQTTAITLPGNSGGPLIDEMGTVIGINTAMGLSNAGHQFGFAIMIDEAIIKIIGQLKAGQIPKHAFLGVVTADAGELDEIGPPAGGDISGAFIEMVLPGSPAQMAGLQKGDVIRAIDDKRIYSSDDLISRLNRAEPGQEIKIDAIRPRKNAFDEYKTINVRIEERAKKDIKGYIEEAASQSVTVWGMEIKPLTEWRKEKCNLPQFQTGLFIYEVEINSQAWKNGARPGGVIVGIGNYRVERLTDLAEIITKYREYKKMPRIDTVRQIEN